LWDSESDSRLQDSGLQTPTPILEKPRLQLAAQNQTLTLGLTVRHTNYVLKDDCSNYVCGNKVA